MAVDPQHKTVVGCTFPLGLSQKELASNPKELHLITTGDDEMGTFKFTQKREGTKLNLELYGDIDEDTTFATVDLQGVTDLRVDWGGVVSINSCGIREWILWIKKLSPEARCKFVQCQKVVVDQMNMIRGFLLPEGQVESFFVSYYCVNCTSITSRLCNFSRSSWRI